MRCRTAVEATCAPAYAELQVMSNFSFLTGASHPEELVAQLVSPHHQYPDGAVLFLGTPFSPAKDRGAPGLGFTHKAGDVVRISTPKLGALENTVLPTDQCPPWRFGTGALFASLAARGLPR